MQKLSLGMLGFLFIVGASVSHMLAGPPRNASEALGQGTASLLLALIGVGLIVAHLIKKGKERRQ